MSDFGRSDRDADDDRLPWLEPVDEEDEQLGPSLPRLIGGVLIALVAIGLLIAGVLWLKNKAGEPSGPGSIIRAPAGDYKVRPEAPGGMAVQGSGDSTYAASQGADPNAPIDLSGQPEAPITADAGSATGTSRLAPTATPPAAAPVPPPAKVATVTVPASTAARPAARSAAAQTAPAPAQVPARASVPASRPVPAAAPATPPVAEAPPTGGTIQLGAFSSEAKANAAWKALSKRFGYLAPLTSSVAPVTTDAGTLYRLRVSAGGGAAATCAKLRVAGESCVVIGG